MFKEKLSELFEVAGEDVQRDFFNDEAERCRYAEEYLIAFLDELEKQDIKYKNVESFGGEGKGEEFYTIYSFSKAEETLFIKFDGNYQSYHGSEYNCMFFVKPQEVTVTEYLCVK